MLKPIGHNGATASQSTRMIPASSPETILPTFTSERKKIVRTHQPTQTRRTIER